jgi:hypothetical protein
MATPEAIQVSREVQEIVAICFLGVIAYLLIICCIMCRGPAILAEGLEKDVNVDSFIGRQPESDETAYFQGSRMEVVKSSAGNHCGRLIVHSGTATFKNGNGITTKVDRAHYAVFEPGEKFELLDQSEDFLFHLDLYSSLSEVQNKPKTS